jgi:hypothetical protein
VPVLPTPERHSTKRPALLAAGGFAHYVPLSFARSAPVVGEAKEIKSGGFRLPLIIFPALWSCESHHSSLFYVDPQAVLLEAQRQHLIDPLSFVFSLEAHHKIVGISEFRQQVRGNLL